MEMEKCTTVPVVVGLIILCGEDTVVNCPGGQWCSSVSTKGRSNLASPSGGWRLHLLRPGYEP